MLTALSWYPILQNIVGFVLGVISFDGFFLIILTVFTLQNRETEPHIYVNLWCLDGWFCTIKIYIIVIYLELLDCWFWKPNKNLFNHNLNTDKI